MSSTYCWIAADKVHLWSVSSPHVASWLSAVPSECLGLHMDQSPVFQVAIKWWLGLDTSESSQCALLDHLGHHAVTRKYGGDLVSRHNRIRDILVEICHSGLGGSWQQLKSRPQQDPSGWYPTSQLVLGQNSSIRCVDNLTAKFDHCWKQKCQPQLLPRPLSQGSTKPTTLNAQNWGGCVYIWWLKPMGLGERKPLLSSPPLPLRLAISICWPKSIVLSEIYGRLNLNLFCANRTAVLSRIGSSTIERLNFAFMLCCIYFKCNIKNIKSLEKKIIQIIKNLK